MHLGNNVRMHILQNAISLIQRKKLYSCLSSLPEHMKICSKSLESLVIDMPVLCSYFVRQSNCQPSSKAVVTHLSVRNGTIESIVVML